MKTSTSKIATFHPLRTITDQNMDQHTESGWKHDPTAADRKIDEDESSKLLTAFSWKEVLG